MLLFFESFQPQNNLRNMIFYGTSLTIQNGNRLLNIDLSQPAIACSKLTIETLEQGVKYVQS